MKAIKFHPSKEVLITGSDRGKLSLFELCREDSSLEMKKGDFFLQDVKFDAFFLDSMEFFNEGRSLLVHASNRVGLSVPSRDGAVEICLSPSEVLLLIRLDGGQGVAAVPTAG